MASLRNKKIVLSPGQQYDFPIDGDSIRLVSSNVPIYFKTRDGDLDFYLEQGEKASFKGQGFLTLTIYHLDGADQTVIISVGKDADVGSARFSGNVSISSAVALDAAALAAIQNRNLGFTYGANYRSTAAIAANTAETVFTAGSNVNGAIIHSIQMIALNGTGAHQPTFLAKATAPANVSDGEPILSPDFLQQISGIVTAGGSLKNPLRIAAGKGLFYINSAAESAGYSSRSVLYTLL